MFAVFRKELTVFFSSLIGYIAICVFLILMGLFLWILPNNILEEGYATLSSLFGFGPRILLLLIPAITMRSFAEEKKQGTIEILSTKPLTTNQIIGGKYFAGLVLVALSLIPTLIYYYSVSQLAEPKGNLDHGAIIGSYLGLFLIASAYLSIGLFTSSITDNQIVAFISALFLCFFFYLLLGYLSEVPNLKEYENITTLFSLDFHYQSISKGIIDTRDIVFFISFTLAFLYLTKILLEKKRWS